MKVERNDETLVSQEPPHSSPYQVSYGVSVVWILDIIDGVITSLYCIKYLKVELNSWTI